MSWMYCFSFNFLLHEKLDRFILEYNICKPNKNCLAFLKTKHFWIISVRVVRFNHDGQLIVTGHDTGAIEVSSKLNNLTKFYLAFSTCIFNLHFQLAFWLTIFNSHFSTCIFQLAFSTCIFQPCIFNSHFSTRNF